MKYNLKRNFKNKQYGQAMIEYTIVVVVGILLVTTGPMRDVITELTDAISNNYKGYSYAISLNDIPMSDKQQDYEKILKNMNVEQELQDILIDDPVAYHTAIKKYNIPQPPSPTQVINKLKQEAENTVNSGFSAAARLMP
jgi:Flp pilus assembly pilin Flp